ncbi:hypothetical protein FKM82_025148 [Ascaphus truei]
MTMIKGLCLGGDPEWLWFQPDPEWDMHYMALCGRIWVKVAPHIDEAKQNNTPKFEEPIWPPPPDNLTTMYSQAPNAPPQEFFPPDILPPTPPPSVMLQIPPYSPITPVPLFSKF